MVDQPDNLTLVLLREMRAETATAMEAFNTSMRSMLRMHGRLPQFQDEIFALRGDVAARRGESSEFRTDMRKTLVRLESDILLLENPNISRHGETLNALKRIADLERAAS